MKDYYYLLGIEKNATSEEIKQAYRKLSRKFHPDKNNNDIFFNNKSKEINEAYRILSKEKKRENYNFELEYFYFNKRKNKFDIENIKKQKTKLIFITFLNLFIIIFFVFYLTIKKSDNQSVIEKKENIILPKNKYIISYFVTSSEAKAQILTEELKEKGFNAFYKKEKLFFRVFVKNFKNLEEAKIELKLIQNINKQAFLKKL